MLKQAISIVAGGSSPRVLSMYVVYVGDMRYTVHKVPMKQSRVQLIRYRHKHLVIHCSYQLLLTLLSTEKQPVTIALPS